MTVGRLSPRVFVACWVVSRACATGSHVTMSGQVGLPWEVPAGAGSGTVLDLLTGPLW